MIRAALQRPGRLRMRLTVVAAASALFALVVLAALVLPSLQHNLEQSRVDSLRASVLASTAPQHLLRVRSAAPTQPRTMQTSARHARRGRASRSSRSTASSCRPSPTRSTAPARRSALELVRGDGQPAPRPRRPSTQPARRAHGRADVLRLQTGQWTASCSSRRRCATCRSRSRPSSGASCSAASLAFGVALLAGALAAEPLARRLARLRAAADRIAHGSFAEPIVDR